MRKKKDLGIADAKKKEKDNLSAEGFLEISIPLSSSISPCFPDNSTSLRLRTLQEGENAL